MCTILEYRYIWLHICISMNFPKKWNTKVMKNKTISKNYVKKPHKCGFYLNLVSHLSKIRSGKNRVQIYRSKKTSPVDFEILIIFSKFRFIRLEKHPGTLKNNSVSKIVQTWHCFEKNELVFSKFFQILSLQPQISIFFSNYVIHRTILQTK